MENKVKIANIELSGDKFQITSKNDFFSEQVKIEITHEKVIFSHITLDDNSFYSPAKRLNNVYQISITSYDLTEGVYPIDEDESNEDQLVIYFEDKIIET